MILQLAAMLPGGPKAYHSPHHSLALLRICSGDAATSNTVSMHDHAPCAMWVARSGLYHVFVCSDSIDIPMSLEVTIQSLYWPGSARWKMRHRQESKIRTLDITLPCNTCILQAHLRPLSQRENSPLLLAENEWPREQSALMVMAIL